MIDHTIRSRITICRDFEIRKTTEKPTTLNQININDNNKNQ